MHAAGQDLEVLELGLRHLPDDAFDTQLAAGFAGYATPSLAALAEQVVGVRLPKGDRLTDWLRRPLDADQLRYAAADVAHLFAIQDHLIADLQASGRLEWALDECEQLRTREPLAAGARGRVAAHQGGPPPPRPHRRHRPCGRGVARATGRRDRPAGPLHPPGPRGGRHRAAGPRPRRDQLRAIRGLDDRHVQGPPRRGAARRRSPTAASTRRCGPGRTRSSSSSASSARRSPSCRPGSASSARDLRIDTSLLATRADIEALLGGIEDGRLSVGLAGRPRRRADPPPREGRRRPRLRRQGRPPPRGALPQAHPSDIGLAGGQAGQTA